MFHRVATLDSSKKPGSDSSDSNNDEEGHRQEFFVGGGANSGQQVLGPNSSHNDDIASQLFKLARVHGAEPLTPEENAKYGTRSAVKFVSSGKGYRLGDNVKPSEMVEAAVTETESQEVVLVLYDNGFTVDDGPLRLYGDPSNDSFLRKISEGHIPSELLREYPGKVIDIRMERRNKGYVEHPKPFTGQGKRLGSIVPAFTGTEQMEGSTEASINENIDPNCVNKAQEAIKLSDEEPITRVNIRLPRGGRIIGKFNHSHTVRDIRNFLIAAAPDYAFRTFNFMTAFPHRVIEEEDVSLKEAGLLNAVINQMSLREVIGLRVWTKFFRIIKNCGGLTGFVKKRYLYIVNFKDIRFRMDETRIGKLVGEDKFGNKYYEDNSYFIPRNRWVEYPEHVWLEYDPSQIPSEWHMWLHHITDETPVQNPPVQRKWMLDHEETLTLLNDRKYYPYSTTREKLTLWNPNYKKAKY
ncbi:unnamed protein product [Thelazia callipaeda]|uniref:UBX domain-containing protein n=1 Tax=Thelazia callipaeda TaxID=103827 RepID=A0A0N5CJ81_THECL|nr:unnamed protein product [Thelazia callipaeda]